MIVLPSAETAYTELSELLPSSNVPRFTMPFMASQRNATALVAETYACPTTTDPSAETPVAMLTAPVSPGTAPGNSPRILQFFPPCQIAAWYLPCESGTVPTMVLPSREMDRSPYFA